MCFTLHHNKLVDFDYRTLYHAISAKQADDMVFCLLSDSEMYEDLCEPEDDGKFDQMLSDELIAGITSCMSDDLSMSLEQFHKINCLDGSAEIESSDSHYLLFSRDVTDDEVVGTESCGSDEDDVSKKSDHSDTMQFTVTDVDVGTDPYSPDSELANLEYEELYEESVSIVEAIPSTISRRELQDLMTSSFDKSVVKLEPLDDVEAIQLPRLRPPTELTSSRRLRKKEQNKTAALRYRLKKRSEQGLVMTEYSMLERKNIELRTRLDEMTKEISYLKALINELCP